MNVVSQIKDGRALIVEPGIYPHITNEQYHGAEPCDAPSISSTGLKKLVPHIGLQAKGHSPRHYWQGSPLNPSRRPVEQTDALRIGAAFHDLLLLPDEFADRYHVTPAGFSRAQTVKQAGEIAAYEQAITEGLTILSDAEIKQITAMVSAIREHPNANAILSSGVAEMTLAWKDEETGVWLRCRPDWIAFGRPIGINVKSTADASHAGFQSDVTKYRYAQSAALEIDGLHILADHIKALSPSSSHRRITSIPQLRSRGRTGDLAIICRLPCGNCLPRTLNMAARSTAAPSAFLPNV